MSRITLLLLLACLVAAEEASDAAAAFWRYRGLDIDQPIQHEDILLRSLRDPAYTGPRTVVLYRFNLLAEDGQQTHHRTLLMLCDGPRLLGGYNITGASLDYASARFDGTTLVMPGVPAIQIWPPPATLVEPTGEKGLPAQRFLFHEIAQKP